MAVLAAPLPAALAYVASKINAAISFERVKIVTDIVNKVHGVGSE